MAIIYSSMQFNAMTLQMIGDRLHGNNILHYAVQCNDIAGNTHISTLNTTEKDCGGHTSTHSTQ